MTEPAPAPPAKRRKRFGLSLRVLMVLVLLLGGGMGWIAYRARVQREAVAAIEAAGGKAYYDFEWAHSDFVDMPQFFGDFTPIESRRPKWIVDLLGPDYLGSVVAVQFLNNSSNKIDDKLMRRIGRLSPGDRLYLYSDGLPEAMNPGGKPFGDARLLEAIGQARSEALQEDVATLLQRVAAWHGSERPHDDISVLAVEVSVASGPASILSRIQVPL